MRIVGFWKGGSLGWLLVVMLLNVREGVGIFFSGESLEVFDYFRNMSELSFEKINVVGV